MALDGQWSQRGRPGEARKLEWRPFQLGFQLLVIPSLARREHPDREVMDLLWFPTGGGKTEAYLGLIAFLLFYRRLLPGGPSRGAGVAVLMRYTLRLLTIQQFQRAATLISACEKLRRESTDELGKERFSLGLWVGSAATPNSVSEAAKQLGSGDDPTPKQLVVCPVCQQQKLRWFSRHKCSVCGRLSELNGERCGLCGKFPPARKSHGAKEIRVVCEDKTCEFGSSPDPYIPIWTVDDDIYRERPSLVIGTVNKVRADRAEPGDLGPLWKR